MRLRLLLAVSLLAALHAFCQQATKAPTTQILPKDARTFFETAIPHYDFSDKKLRPWHLKAHYEIYDFEGKLATEGTWEYWWASPKVRRRSWERPGLSRTDWITEDGTIFRKTSGEPTDFFERGLENLILYPGPNYEWIKSGWLKLDWKEKGPESTGPICITTTLRLAAMSDLHTPSDYCFDPTTMAILATYSKYILAQYSQFVVFQNHYVARHITEQVMGQAKLIVSVDPIEGIPEGDPALTPAVDAVPLPGHAHYTSDSRDRDRGKEKKIVKTTSPDTVGARDKRGIVWLVVETGTDDKVRTVEALVAPSRQLAESAIDLVKKWEFKSAIVNDKPIESEFPIQFIF
jgi:hypothetical protein